MRLEKFLNYFSHLLMQAWWNPSTVFDGPPHYSPAGSDSANSASTGCSRPLTREAVPLRKTVKPLSHFCKNDSSPFRGAEINRIILLCKCLLRMGGGVLLARHSLKASIYHLLGLVCRLCFL